MTAGHPSNFSIIIAHLGHSLKLLPKIYLKSDNYSQLSFGWYFYLQLKHNSESQILQKILLGFLKHKRF